MTFFIVTSLFCLLKAPRWGIWGRLWGPSGKQSRRFLHQFPWTFPAMFVLPLPMLILTIPTHDINFGLPVTSYSFSLALSILISSIWWVHCWKVDKSGLGGGLITTFMARSNFQTVALNFLWNEVHWFFERESFGLSSTKTEQGHKAGTMQFRE